MIRKKTIVYNPVVGEVWPDSEVKGKAFLFLTEAEETITTGSELFCHYARALYTLNDYGFDLYFDFNNEFLKVSKGGKLKHWPEGFCGYFDSALDILLKISPWQQ